MTEEPQAAYLRIVGARVLSEANDLKRTPEALARELGFAQDQIKAVIAGDADMEMAFAVLHTMVKAYPVSLADLWVEQDDTDCGVRVMTAAQSASSRRVFDRRNDVGGLSPYYEYRDTAMSRIAPFKPEWIKELRVVTNAHPDNPDVAYNNGHLMHQTTFFVGPVNFYWKVNGQFHCAELNTGDSNYITPFVPHSFTSREASRPGVIIAVTYGGDVRRALSDFARLGAGAAEDLVADPRGPKEAFVRLLSRQAAAESLTKFQLITRMVTAGIEKGRAHALVSVGGATKEEIETIAAALSIRPVDLLVTPLERNEEVVVRRRVNAVTRHYPDEGAPAYTLTELARTRHQPYLKGFDAAVLGGNNGDMQHSLHEYLYNYGEVPVVLVWGEGRRANLAPNDSAYVRPAVKHRFELPEGAEPGALVMMRIPGALSGPVVSEFSTFAPEGRHRVTGETKRWF